MKRVVITGLGIVSCLGNDAESVVRSLQEQRSGLRFNPIYAEMGFRSHVCGRPEIVIADHIDRKALRFMGDGSAYAAIALQQAIKDAQLPESLVSSDRTGLVAGSGGASSLNHTEATDTARSKGIKRISPYTVPRTMSSTVSACMSTAFHIRGVSYTIASACATSAHCIGHAMELIQLGKQDIVFAGGGEEESWQMSCQFDAMGALSSHYNDQPERASRAYDADRDGFVIAGGGGMVVVEEYEHALRRGAPIYAEIVGYGATSDGADMVAPSGEGAARCMRIAMAGIEHPIDYINTHGTSTVVGDLAELGAIRDVFGAQMPLISSTKSLSGHSLGAAGVHEAIYSMLMLKHEFVAGSAHINRLAPEAEGMPILRQSEPRRLNTVMSNSFGFGGTNATLVLRRLD